MKDKIEEDIKYLRLIRTEGLEKIGYVYAREAIDNVLADRERLEKENKKNKDALELLNKMKKKYKLALFMIIRNSVVMPKGIKLQKSSKEISQMSYETLCKVLNMIDFNTAEKMYKEGKEK